MDDINSEDEQELMEDITPEFISREEWGAMESKKKKKLNLPVSKVLFTTTESVPCYSKSHCKHNVKALQKELQSQWHHDIPHNFLIGREGRVYEVMGWNHQAECNINWLLAWLNPDDKIMKEMRETSIDVAFIGHHDLKPNAKQLKAALGLVFYGIKNQYLSENVDIIEDNVIGPLFPNEMRNEVEDEELTDKEKMEAQLLRMINEGEKEEDKLTMEQMQEELKDVEGINRKFKEFDEELKAQNQKLIEERYPWAFQNKSS